MAGDPQLKTKQRLGPYIPQFGHGGDIHNFARAHGLQPQEVLDFSASINPLGWPRGLMAAARRALSLAVHYPEPYAETLTTALAQYHDLDHKTLLVGNGSTQLIYLLARTLKPQRVLIVAPSFSEHEAAVRRVGARVSHMILRPPTFTLAVEDLRRRLDEGYDTLILTNPNSPTGTLVAREALLDLVQVCRRLSIRLLVDETFIDWVEDASLKDLAARHSHLFVLRSLTKFFALPGLRVGYLITHPQQGQRLKKQLEPWSVNTVAQLVGIACLEDQQFIQRSRVFMRRERQWLTRQLQMTAGLEPFSSVANFLLVSITHDQLTATDLAHQLAASHILIRDCRNFVGLGNQFFRVAVRQRMDNRRLLAALHPLFSSRREEE